MARKRTVCVVTGARSEYGLLKPLLVRIEQSTRLALKLLITGMHLLPEFGLTINEIKKDGFRIHARIPMYAGNSKCPDYYTDALAVGVKNFSQSFINDRPNILVVLGDRPEPLAAVLSASFLNIPIAHIQGGDRTEASDLDEYIRHAITRFAHVHFPATAKAKMRLVKSGEEPWRIFNVGALGVDSLLAEPRATKAELFKKFNLSDSEKLIICLFHPIHLRPSVAGREMKNVLESLKEMRVQSIVIFPNNDAGNQKIIAQIQKYAKLPFIQAFPSLPHSDYVNLLRHADVLVGNSSGGIIETPTLKIPFVNVGDRQKARERSTNVIDVAARTREIAQAIGKSLYNKRFISRVAKCKSPYGKGGASREIVARLESVALNRALLEKKITY